MEFVIFIINDLADKIYGNKKFCWEVDGNVSNHHPDPSEQGKFRFLYRLCN